MYYLVSRNLCSRDVILVYRYIKKEITKKTKQEHTYLGSFQGWALNLFPLFMIVHFDLLPTRLSASSPFRF